MVSTKSLFINRSLTLPILSPSVPGSFHFDDDYILDDPIVQPSSGCWGVLRLEHTGPPAYVTCWFNYQRRDVDPVGYYLHDPASTRHRTDLPSFVRRRS